MCFNRNVLVGLAVIAGGVSIFAPQSFLAAVPVLLVLACPLSMIVMMRAMNAKQCSNAPDEAKSTIDDRDKAAEIARLRAEADQLRAELRDGPQDRLTSDLSDRR